MAKILECAKVDPSSGCKHIVRGETVEEVLQKAAEHAKEHGIRQVTPELIERASKQTSVTPSWRWTGTIGRRMVCSQITATA